MNTCPWCGTTYTDYRETCKNCGGSLPPPRERGEAPFLAESPVPPPAPRDVPRDAVWRMLLGDGWAIAAAVFLLLGGIFGAVGIGLTVGIITAFVGLPFAGLGVVFFGGGAAVLWWRYQKAQQTVHVLRDGEAVEGQIAEVYQNLAVRVNGRHPWTILYRYQVGGQLFEGSVTTLRPPTPVHQQGQGVYVLYWPEEPGLSTLYPYPG